MQRLALLLVLLCNSLVAGWLPADKNLFERHSYGSKDTRTPGKTRDRRYLPPTKIRGVNLGGQFISEPWLMDKEWANMGCGAYKAESDCVKGLGQEKANDVFKDHWNTWIVEDDLDRIKQYGLNTIRIPVGWWMLESLVNDDEYFPQKAYPFFHQICGWAAQKGLYVIADLHALPGAQRADTPYTGLYTDSPGFYQESQYQRAYDFLTWLTTQIHGDDNYRTVGMIEVANEPLPNEPSLYAEYYPGALAAIRNAEASAGIKPGDSLTVQFMDFFWNYQNPVIDIAGASADIRVAFDDHYYLINSAVPATQNDWVSHTCTKDYSNDNSPLLTGEWSLALNETQPGGFVYNENVDANSFAKTFWAASIQSFEQNLGWVFWTWKTDLDGYSWDYQNAVAAGVISTDPTEALSMNVCGS